MIIQNSKKILVELGRIEAEITKIEQIVHNQDLNIDLEKLLEEILQSYCRDR